MTSHTSGSAVTHMYFHRCILIRMVVATHSAIGGQQLIRDAEQRPQRIDAAQRIDARPDIRKYPHASTMAALVPMTPGIQLGAPERLVDAARAGPAA